jgi:hypothetical protein
MKIGLKNKELKSILPIGKEKIRQRFQTQTLKTEAKIEG